MNILAFLASFILLTSPYSVDNSAHQKKTDPVILIYWERGFSFEPPPYQLEFAAWADGRVMWCDMPREWVQVNGKWQWTEGKHFEAKIDREKIQQVVNKVRATGAFGLMDWNLLPPDSSSHTVIVRSGKSGLTLTCSHDPPDKPVYGRDPAQYAKQLRAWRLVWQLAAKLKSEEGRQIKAPEISRWRLER